MDPFTIVGTTGAIVGMLGRYRSSVLAALLGAKNIRAAPK